MRKKILYPISTFLLLSLAVKGQAQISYEKEIESWKQKRIAGLKAENGWLNLVGLYWLQQGKNSFGSGDDVAIKFPKSTIVSHAGYFDLKVTTVTLFANDSADIQVNGKPSRQAILFSVDSFKTPVASTGSLKWTIIKRDDKIGIRLRDLNSELVKNFTGLNYFTIDSSYKIKAHLQQSQQSVLSITNILGQTNQEKTPGKLIFTLHGVEYSLDALQEGNQLFIIFGDATSGKETYPSGRFLYAALPDAEGNTVLDFNKAYNPPCAFTPYATCPIPPKQNILSVSITAGEKNYGHH